MKTSDFYYDLPKELIAQTPLQKRDSSRMMVIDRKSGAIEHKHFFDTKYYLKPGDCLVLNDTRVLPARIYGARSDTGAVVEFLLLKQKGDYVWECLAGPGKKAKVGASFKFSDKLTAVVLEVLPDGNRILEFSCEGEFLTVLSEIGEMPLPPYISEKLKDKERYQTVYSNIPGSAAAPTAGLHFTKEILADLESSGISIAYVTLHVGLGTFRPVKVDDVTKHHMHSEWYSVSNEAAEKINNAKKNGGRIICVGTTSCRTLESVAAKYGEIKPCSGDTDIFIYPGFEFKIMDGLLTNFHLPESTLIMLVSAFAGYENIMNAYKVAVAERYRFFSFGDCSLII